MHACPNDVLIVAMMERLLEAGAPIVFDPDQ
jgi:hypothetical protein